MDAQRKDNLEPETNMSAEWRINGTNLPNSSMGLMPCSGNNPMRFCPTIWDQPSCPQSLGFRDTNLRQNASVSAGPLVGGMGWAPPEQPTFMETFSGLHSQIPADSGFIERAARFSCFGTGNFADIMNPFCTPESPNPMQGMQSQRDEINMLNSKGDTVNGDRGATARSPLMGKSEILARSRNEGKRGTNDASELGSDEAEFSCRYGAQGELEGTIRASSGKGLGSKKRKRTRQDSKIDESNRAAETRDEDSNNGTEIQDPQTSDQPKEAYIHVRARRGQATNSHSLAERVRREKISERMKFLQDLVPGCSKVTGKAVMLDEIINYVQSLQRQVEFLSMKLATVNPRLDIDIESLFTKDAFPHNSTMPYHRALHYSPPDQIQAGVLGVGGSSDALGRFINPEFTNPMPQTGSWEDELHNVIQMGLNTVVPHRSQDLNAS